MILLRKVLAGTADNVLPQVLFDVTTDADETGKCEKCTNNKEYWLDNKSMCKDIGCKYSGGGGGGGGTKSTCRTNRCKDDKDYYKSHKACCNNKNAPYEPHGPTYGKHKCEENIHGFWDNNKAWCKRHGWCPSWYTGKCGSSKDAKIIADILTDVYDDENFQVEDFQDEDFQDEDDEENFQVKDFQDKDFQDEDDDENFQVEDFQDEDFQDEEHFKYYPENPLDE